MSESTSDPDAVIPVEATAEAEGETEEESMESTSRSFEIGDLVIDREPADGNANTAVVVNCPPVPASEWTAYGGTTVAEDNPNHPEDASVIVVVYRSELDRFDPEWADRADLNPYPLTEFNEAGVSTYSFPATRLQSRSVEVKAGSTPAEKTSGPEDEGSDGNRARMSRITHENTSANSNRTADSQPEASAEPDHGEAEGDEPQAESREPTDAALGLRDRLEGGGMTVEIEADGRTLAAEKLGETYRVRPGGDILEGDGLFAAKLKRIAAEFESQRQM